MATVAQGQLVVVGAREVQFVGALELLRVAVRCGHDQVDTIASGDLRSAQLERLLGDPPHPQDRRLEAQQLFDHSGHAHVEVFAQARELRGMLDQDLGAVADQVGRGLVASEQHYRARGEELRLVEAIVSTTAFSATPTTLRATLTRRY